MYKGEGILSPPTVLRLSEYLLILEQFLKENKETISSRELAVAYGNNANQVRQDIFHLKKSGRVGQGYSTRELADEIRFSLGLNKIKKICIVGAGNLGTALATHVPFSQYGMKLTKIFDVDKNIIGVNINDLKVEPYSNLVPAIKNHEMEIAAICVPAPVAQDVCDDLVKGGIKGILNYSRVRLKAPDYVSIQYQQVICSFMQLTYKVNNT